MTNYEIRSSSERAFITAGICLLLLDSKANPFQFGNWFHLTVEIFFWVSAISAILTVVIGLLIKISEAME